MKDDFEIMFFEDLRRRMPEDVEVLKILGDHYTKCGRHQDGLEVDRLLARLLPQEALVHYNLACSLALVGDVRESAEAITKSFHLGYCDWDYLKKDEDLENLRASAEFEKIKTLFYSQKHAK